MLTLGKRGGEATRQLGSHVDCVDRVDLALERREVQLRLKNANVDPVCQHHTIVTPARVLVVTSSFGSLLSSQTFSALSLPNLFSAVFSAFLRIQASYLSSVDIPFIVKQCLKSSNLALQSCSPPYRYTAFSCGPSAKHAAHLSNMLVHEGISETGVDALWYATSSATYCSYRDNSDDGVDDADILKTPENVVQSKEEPPREIQLEASLDASQTSLAFVVGRLLPCPSLAFVS